MYYETDKKTFVSNNFDKGAYLLCVVVKEITVAGGSSFSFSCSSSVAVETMVLIQTAAAVITADVDAEITVN